MVKVFADCLFALGAGWRVSFFLPEHVEITPLMVEGMKPHRNKSADLHSISHGRCTSENIQKLLKDRGKLLDRIAARIENWDIFDEIKLDAVVDAEARACLETEVFLSGTVLGPGLAAAPCTVQEATQNPLFDRNIFREITAFLGVGFFGAPRLSPEGIPVLPEELQIDDARAAPLG